MQSTATGERLERSASESLDAGDAAPRDQLVVERSPRLEDIAERHLAHVDALLHRSADFVAMMVAGPVGTSSRIEKVVSLEGPHERHRLPEPVERRSREAVDDERDRHEPGGAQRFDTAPKIALCRKARQRVDTHRIARVAPEVACNHTGLPSRTWKGCPTCANVSA